MDDTGSAPISSAQLHLVFIEPHKTISASAPVKTLNMPAGGSSALGFSSCSLGLSTFYYQLTGTISFWSPARPGHTGTTTLPTVSSASF